MDAEFAWVLGGMKFHYSNSAEDILDIDQSAAGFDYCPAS